MHRHMRGALAMTMLVVVAASAFRSTVAAAATPADAHVAARLVAEQTALVPGSTATVALRLDIESGWHTYWRNPGESGLPTTLAWKLPPGYKAGDIEWPAPRALAAGPLVNYGYENVVFHLVPVVVPADAKPGTTATLAARADWLVCRETCIPEGADLSLALPVATSAQPDPKWAEPIANARAALPRPLPGWHAGAVASGSTVALTLTPPQGAPDPGALQFFAQDERRIAPSVAQSLARRGDGSYVLTLPVASDLAAGFDRLRGVATAAGGFADETGPVHAMTLDVALSGTPIAGPKARAADATVDFAAAAQPAGASFAASLVFAFVGGLLLNLMPCVFPVLSLKALGLAAARGAEKATMRAQGLAFAAGVVTTFVALAALLIVLRGAGEQLGWGFQLQSPAVVTALAVLFFALALNLSGLFEFGSLVPSGMATWSHSNRQVDAFASGVLAVVIASPCTAPFMGAALGYALGAAPQVTFGVFVALGLGMALPYVALAWFPAWRRVLPRPGPWMVRLKQLLAFPLYATVVWLVWVLGAQLDNDAVLRVGVVLVVVAFALWAWRGYRGGGARGWGVVAVAGALAGLAIAWPLLGGGRAGLPVDSAVSPSGGAQAPGEGQWLPYSEARVAQLTDEGRTVFVDFTAAWCVTCQVNERFVLHSPAVREEFKRLGIVLVRADWTRRDPEITRSLAALGRSGVPVYAFYRKGRPPQLLPEILQKKTVLDALAAL
ncbi:MAG TPA: thioredoxin family protein [Casimicrobiaceae bacterium]|nr:thioredoxin family protein [Casimicrobiaceae bacterium]